MLFTAIKKHRRLGEKVKVVALTSSEQARRVEAAVARRAYKIFENRGSASWHELEDWRQAETELLRPCCSGQMSVDGLIRVGTDAHIFEEGTIEIWVAPHRLTICGKPRTTKAGAGSKGSASGHDAEMIFHVVELTGEVNPLLVTPKINGPSLEVMLGKAVTELEKVQGAKAAAAS